MTPPTSSQILWTGFEPFGGRDQNVSEMALSRTFPQNSVVLPVAYDRATQVLLEHLKGQPHVSTVVMVGEAGDRRRVGLEKWAHNWRSNLRVPDAQGRFLRSEKIDTDGPDLYETPVDVVTLGEELLGRGLPVEVSLTAGSFVCNDTYYQVLGGLEREGKGRRALFVHLPLESDLPVEVSAAVLWHLGQLLAGS